MIYISTSCIKKKNIKESVIELINRGIRNIELSGGTEYYESIESDLLELKEKHQLNFLLHNYFPPPKEHFVINLASSDSSVVKNSINHIEKAISLSKKLNGQKYAIHAGFFVSPNVKELGNTFNSNMKTNKEKGYQTFIKNYRLLQQNIFNIDIYLENNVLSKQNLIAFGDNPFMLTNSMDYEMLKKDIDFNLLLDIAHLKVSCNSLNLDFEKELQYLASNTDYIHLSDNDGLSDNNLEIKDTSVLFSQLKNCNLKGKTITLEVYSDIDKIIETSELIASLL